jgi:thiol-disulfide isomerase/thioredoxin
MNRSGIILATICAALALLLATFGAMRGTHAAAEATSPRAPHAAAASKTKPASSPNSVAQNSNPAKDPGNGTRTGSEPATASTPDDDDLDMSVIRFAANPSPLPLFMARELGGTMVSTAALKGKVVIVNFWATWCPPCREEIPELVKLQAAYKDQLQVVGVSEDEASDDAVKAFTHKFGINYPIVKVSDEIERDFGGVPALPTSFIVNKDGGIVQKHVGLYPIEVYDREIRALLGMPVDVRIETFKDTGQIFLKNAENATELPGVGLASLTAKQKQAALRRMNTESCTCGCRLTIAQCRINDSACATSRKIAAKIVKEVAAGEAAPPPPPPSTDDTDTQSR